MGKHRYVKIYADGHKIGVLGYPQGKEIYQMLCKTSFDSEIELKLRKIYKRFSKSEDSDYNFNYLHYITIVFVTRNQCKKNKRANLVMQYYLERKRYDSDLNTVQTVTKAIMFEPRSLMYDSREIDNLFGLKIHREQPPHWRLSNNYYYEEVDYINYYTFNVYRTGTPIFNYINK